MMTLDYVVRILEQVLSNGIISVSIPQLWKESLDNDSQRFHQYQQYDQSPRKAPWEMDMSKSKNVQESL
jgi:hypothetical protein